MPATAGCEAAPAIGFIAHMDTSPDASGAADEAYVSRRGERRYKRRALQAETTKKPEISNTSGHSLGGGGGFLTGLWQ